MASIQYDIVDSRPFVYASLGGRDSMILVDTGASISVSNLSLPLTDNRMNLQGLSGASIFTQSKLVPLQIYPFDKPFWVQFWVGDSQVGTVMGVDILNQIEADILLTKGQLISPAFCTPIAIRNKAGVPKMSVSAVIQTSNDSTDSPIMQYLTELFPGLWSVSKLDVGLCKIDPLNVSGPHHPPVFQYPLRREAERAAQEIVNHLHSTGIVVRCSSPTNSPMCL